MDDKCDQRGFLLMWFFYQKKVAFLILTQIEFMLDIKSIQETVDDKECIDES